MRRFAVIPVLCLAACGSLRRGEGAADAGPLRVCVRNATAGYGNVIAHVSFVRYDVAPGEEVCKSVPGGDPTVALRAVTIGGGAAGPLSYATTLRTGGSSCWRWTLGNLPAAAANATPCDFGPGADTIPGGR